MAKKGLQRRPKRAKSDRLPLIDKELRKRTKAELVVMLLEIAQEHADVARELETRLEIEKPAELLIADIASAIERATDFDERLSNRNFDYDYQAYEEVQKGLTALVASGRLGDAQSLALKLMKAGSYQVECSDEGLMSDDLCECLQPVIQAVAAAGGSDAARWAKEMRKADCVGCHCDEELAQLQGK